MVNIFFQKSTLYIKVLLIGFILNGVLSNQSFADSFEAPSEAWKLSQGGKIYDNWAATLKSAKPSTTHSAYPATGKKTGSSTWRCKECHGWDYRGKDGAYREGSHYTGIKGIRDMNGKPLTTIKKIIRNKEHGYTKSMISDKALNNLALFINKGQFDVSQSIDFTTRKVNGNAKRGANFFQTICAVCHGPDGRKINFHDANKSPEYIGTIANKNPWELLHKMRSGQPGAAMISLRVLDIQVQLDILAYTQLLPKK